MPVFEYYQTPYLFHLQAKRCFSKKYFRFIEKIVKCGYAMCYWSQFVNSFSKLKGYSKGNLLRSGLSLIDAHGHTKGPFHIRTQPLKFWGTYWICSNLTMYIMERSWYMIAKVKYFMWKRSLRKCNMFWWFQLIFFPMSYRAWLCHFEDIPELV